MDSNRVVLLIKQMLNTVALVATHWHYRILFVFWRENKLWQSNTIRFCMQLGCFRYLKWLHKALIGGNSRVVTERDGFRTHTTSRVFVNIHEIENMASFVVLFLCMEILVHHFKVADCSSHWVVTEEGRIQSQASLLCFWG